MRAVFFAVVFLAAVFFADVFLAAVFFFGVGISCTVASPPGISPRRSRASATDASSAAIRSTTCPAGAASSATGFGAEVFWDVAHGVERDGSLVKTDIAALVVWKRLAAQTPWVTALMSLPDSRVRSSGGTQRHLGPAWVRQG
ncbi:hypothetical protein [Streptomyces sp. NPDC007355]|uniref:hypothetical protein n=1 Tax=Streptomyces sp. NPDC007355 TaxID=3364778 RepID=UPI003690C94C